VPVDPRVRIPNPVEGPVKVGDVLAETPFGVRVPVTLFPTIGLNRPGTDRWPVLVTELDDIATWVRTQAVPILITGTPDVDPLLHRHELLGYLIDGRDLPLIDFSRGIRNPARFSSTLSIVSAANGPYDDTESDGGLLQYAHRAGDPFTGDNRKLRAALDPGQPLILFRKEVAKPG